MLCIVVVCKVACALHCGSLTNVLFDSKLFATKRDKQQNKHMLLALQGCVWSYINPFGGGHSDVITPDVGYA